MRSCSVLCVTLKVNRFFIFFFSLPFRDYPARIYFDLIFSHRIPRERIRNTRILSAVVRAIKLMRFGPFMRSTREPTVVGTL